MIGGLITSTFLSLLVIPVLFTTVDDGVQRFQKLFRRRHYEPVDAKAVVPAPEQAR